MTNVGVPYRPIPLATRRDVRTTRQVYRGETYWLVSDPASLEFYRLNDQEHAVLSLLDGRRSLDEIKLEFERRFPTADLSHAEISACIADFFKKSLLSQSTSTQGAKLHRLGVEKRRKKLLKQAAGFLSLRLPGVNPDAFLQAAARRIGWLFSLPMVLVGLLIVLAAATLLASRATEIAGRLPAMQEFFSGPNLALLSFTLIVMKVCHELGHGIVCAINGARCHQLGVMLLIFMPTLYVDTSDSWRLKSKWRRIAIAAAGMYVEMLLAAVAAFVWWNTPPGALHYACLNVMFLGSISTFLFNGNPLLKFDGYFILMDLIEVPNLQQRSANFIRNTFLSFGLGLREGGEHFAPWGVKAWLVSYGVSAYLFRILLSYWIALTLVYLFRPLGLGEAAKLLACFVIGVAVLSPLVSLIKYFRTPGRWSRVDSNRRAWTGLAAGAMAFAGCVLPLPEKIACEFVVEAEDSATVYVQHDAVLDRVLADLSAPVVAGQPIATLKNTDIELEYEKKRGELHQVSEQIATGALLRADSDSDGGAVSMRELRSQKIALEEELENLETIRNQLILTAPRDGYVIPTWRRVEGKSNSLGLGAWDRWTLAGENHGALLHRGEPAFVIGEPHELRVRLLVDQSAIHQLRPGQAAEIAFRDVSVEIGRGQIEQVSNNADHTAPSSLIGRYGGAITADVLQASDRESIRDRDDLRVASSVFGATMRLPENLSSVAIGATGSARITVGRSTVASRAWRFLASTFRHDL